jgi:hypothetical protein
MHCSPSAETRDPRAAASRLVAAAFLSLLAFIGAAAPKPAVEPGFKVLSAGTRLVDGVHRLHATIDFDFSTEAIEAMENGVAVTVALEMQVLEIGRVWDRRVAEVQARYRIQVHALSRQYIVRNLSTGETSTYRTFDEMTAGLGHISGFPLLDDQVLHDGANYRVRLRANLDIESLPTPLRLLAYFKSSWRLSSEWTTWPLAR